MSKVHELPPPSYDPASDMRDENGMVDGVQYHLRTPQEQEAYDHWVNAGKPQRRAQ